jgi:streptogramin lyase
MKKTSDQFPSRYGIGSWLQAAGLTRRTRTQRRRPVLESLEHRTLLTTITEFPTSSSTVDPTAITSGSDGNLWFVETVGNAIGMIDPTSATPHVTTFSNGLPANANLQGITSGPNGDLWFTEGGIFANAIGSIDPNHPSNPIQNFGTAAGMTAESSPTGIAADGADLWFTQPLPAATPQIGELDTTTGKITEFPAPSAMSEVSSQIVLGSDGHLWFTELGNIGIFSTSGSLVNQIPLPGGSNEQALSIAAGPGGTIWYTAGYFNAGHTAFTSSAVGVISASAPGTPAEIPLSSSTAPLGITAGPDGNVWFTVPSHATTAGTIDEISGGTITRTLAIPTTVVATPSPVAITTGHDGNLWFADGSGAVGVVDDTQLVVTSQPAPDVSVGSPFIMTVTDEYTSGAVNTAFNGMVTMFLEANPGGAGTTLGGTISVAAVNGVAHFSNLTLNKAGDGYTLVATSSATNGPTSSAPTSSFDAVVGSATRLAVLSGPPISVTAGSGFSVTVVDEYLSGALDTNFGASVTIAVSANPGGSTFTPVTVSAVGGVANFSGLTLNNVANGYTLQASSGVLTATTNPFNVTPLPPPPPTIVGEAVVFSQKTNPKTHKPKGPKTLSGYTITFDTAMDQTALGNGGNYSVAIEVLKNERVKVGKKTVTKKVLVPKPIGFRVSGVTSTSVTLALAGKQTFPKGGQLTVATGIDNTFGVFLAAPGVFTISKGGKNIS